jgi:tRNA pseudouridine55 synthase
MDGFLIINKEKGLTSFDCLRDLRKILNTKKLGHTGTLDPNATGVLVVAVNRACKTLEMLSDHEKEYLATVKLGILTDTLDPCGNILKEEHVPNIKELDIDEALLKLKDMKTQIPPIYSAIKVNGKKLYEYARENKEVEIKERPCKIFKVERKSDIKIEGNYILFDIYLHVSKGFYVRSFVRDLAKSLGTIGIMNDLVRLSSGNFKLKNSKLIKDISESDIIPVVDAFSDLERVEVKPYLLNIIKNGGKLDSRQTTIDGRFIVTINNNPIAIYERKGNEYYNKYIF